MADADEYDRAPEGSEAALAALGKLTPMRDGDYDVYGRLDVLPVP